ncbi:cellulose binding domain-containing protein [Streptomyces sp. NPDC058632]|uniref:cellulose binding domain-containing protein n=1 Tax=unclassified Streptomyces TaxID=2593676 RepID=UPI0036574811
MVRATGTAAISGWTLEFAFPAGRAISTMWGGTPAQNGSEVTVAAASYTSTIPVDGSVTVGFTGSGPATNPAPTAFALDGTTCAAG